MCRDLIRVAIFLQERFRYTKFGWHPGSTNCWTQNNLLHLGSTIYELGSVKLPDTLHDLPKLLVDMPAILHILDAFDRLCIQSADPPQPTRHRPTVSLSAFNGIFSSTQDRKQLCYLKQYHN
ncbi:hypothetical protein RMCBS344292_07893 [Rhizopus microsporus]|nr:hypothetical protein RMCBS344292_07893 [Rhizopus microsporus]